MAFTPLSEIIGQDQAITLLKGVMSQERIPHAFLFSGISGIGKRTTAIAIAQALNCLNPFSGVGCGTCRLCRQIMKSQFPDLLCIEPDGNHIRIEQIRELNRAIAFRIINDGYRVSIIHKAETMTADAANSFLKTLEEPPPRNILILCVTESLTLLPTITSRCQRVRFQPIPVHEIEEWLVYKKKGLDRDKACTLSRLSEGSLGDALRMYETDFLEKRQILLFKLIELPTLSTKETFDMALELSGIEKKGEGRSAENGGLALSDLIGIWKTWYRDLILIKTEGPMELLINADFSQKLKRISKKNNMNDLYESLKLLDQAQRDILRSRNLDLMMENVLLGLKRLADQYNR